MTLIVPFDGSKLSEAALIRAVQFQTVLEEDVVVVSVIPRNNTEYARERGWIDETEPFDAETVVSYLERTVVERAPEATFQQIFVDRHAPRGTISNRIRRFARDHDASIVFVGSDNAGRMVRGITVGASVAGDRSYDTMIISNEILPEIEKLEEEHPAEETQS
jgi:nucleotide-binding universal stress UspA family protein